MDGVQPVWQLGSGETVYRSMPHAEVPFEALRLLPAALRRVVSNGRPHFVAAVQFDQTIGETVVVPITIADEVVYLQRIGRTGHSAFVLRRQPVPTNELTMILHRRRDTQYELVTAFFGSRSEREPWDPHIVSDHERQRALEFWRSHAFVHGSLPVVAGSGLSDCPWE